MNNLKPLAWRSVVNGTHKVATTHFGTQYALVRSSTDSWVATVEVPRAGREVLRSGTTFAGARKACIDDYHANGGR